MLSTLRCIAIDDEPIALDIIKVHASKVPFLDLKRTFVTLLKPSRFLKQSQSISFS